MLQTSDLPETSEAEVAASYPWVTPEFFGKPLLEINGQAFYTPTPKQWAFHLMPHKNGLYGGAAGGGKSHALRMDAYARCQAVPHYRVLLLRRTFPELRRTHIDRMRVEVPQLGGQYISSEYIARFPNGSCIEVGHCETDADVAKHLSAEYDAVLFDEITTFTHYAVKFVSSRARSTKPGVIPIVRGGTNPGGECADFVKRFFITHQVDPEEDPFYEPGEWGFVQATLFDNPHIDREEYKRRLLALPSEAMRRAYLYGDWDTFEGQYFSEWRAKTDDGRPWHVIDELPTWKGQPVTEVPWIEVFRAMDWGYNDPGVVGWYACLPDGRLIKFKELVFKNLMAREVAERIRHESRGMKVRYTVGDPSMWLKDGSSAESIAETLARHKVPVIPAENERINGWHRLHSWLRATTGNPPVPLLQVYRPGCPYTVRTIPSMVIDPNRPEDLKTKGTEDHAADETRYAVMSRPAPSRESLKRTDSGLDLSITADGLRLLREAQRSRRRINIR